MFVQRDAIMKKLLIAVAFSCLPFSASALSSQVQMVVCGSEDEIHGQLIKDFTETPVAIGIAGGGNGVITLWKSPTGTFTLTTTFIREGRKLVCLVGSGEDWTQAPTMILGTDH